MKSIAQDRTFEILVRLKDETPELISIIFLWLLRPLHSFIAHQLHKKFPYDGPHFWNETDKCKTSVQLIFIANGLHLPLSKQRLCATRK